MEPLDENNHCRLTRAIIERHGGTYDEALATLGKFSLNLVCGPEIADSAALQAALLTAVNTGKRAFLGGVRVDLPSGVPSLLPWPGDGTLNGILEELGAELAVAQHSKTTHTLYFGDCLHPVADGLSVITSGWRGGVAPAEARFKLPVGSENPLAGVLAGSLGVARGFLRISGLSTRFVDKPIGLSLWQPDADDWTDEGVAGPDLAYLPKHLWVLGLGHLGQAFLWNLGLLPFREPAQTRIFLQDFDGAVRSNWSAGLLCEDDPRGVLKTRLCAAWLERRGFQTRLLERPFDESLRLEAGERYVAFCGFDNAAARAKLESAGFQFIVECGLGNTAGDFDQVSFHTFPDATRTPEKIWGDLAIETSNSNPNLLRAFRQPGQPCGILGETLASKTLSSAFVGAYAGALALGEILRGLHGGPRCEAARLQLRSNTPAQLLMLPDYPYQERLAPGGFCHAR